VKQDMASTEKRGGRSAKEGVIERDVHFDEGVVLV